MEESPKFRKETEKSETLRVETNMKDYYYKL